MQPQPPILDFAAYDLNRALIDQEGLRAFNEQRFEMEQLSAVVYADVEKLICVGYRDVARDEFWVNGQDPLSATLPAVLLCEAAAQLCSYFMKTLQDYSDRVLVFAGLDEVEFGAPVRCGDRVVIQGQAVRYRPGVLVSWHFQHFVRGELVCCGTLKGVPIPRAAMHAANAGGTP
jgi:3-hydroxyacyl-[acyl-carrier-protein] dehydratase